MIDATRSPRAAMIYRRFGKTELSMPVFSCGGMRYQFFRRDLPRWLLPRWRRARIDRIVDAALAQGINHFETARDYGTSEKELGRSLARYPRQRYVLQTKVFPLADPGEFRRVLDRSLHNLDAGYVDLFAIHGINTRELLDHAMRDGGCWDVAREYQQAGHLRHIGFSTHAETAVIEELIRSDRFSYVNLHWYFINQVNRPAIEAAREHDLGVFIISPSDKGGMLYRPSAKLVQLCAPLSPMVFNDLFCLAEPAVHTLSIGAAEPGDFAEHLKVLPLLESPGAHLEPILARLHRAAEEALGAEWVATWGENLPRYEDVPGGINIRVILWLQNLLRAYDMLEYARMRYNLLGNGGHWFPGNNAAGVEQLDLSGCLGASPHAAAIPELLAEAHRQLAGRQRRRLSQSWFG